MKKQVTLQEAVDQIKDGMTIMVGGFLAVGAPTQIVDALVDLSVTIQLAPINLSANLSLIVK